MLTLHRPPMAIPAFAALLTFALSAPITIHAEDQFLADGPVNPSDDRIANALFGETAYGDGSGEASHWLAAPECGADPPQSDEPWQAPPEQSMPGEPY